MEFEFTQNLDFKILRTKHYVSQDIMHITIFRSFSQMLNKEYKWKGERKMVNESAYFELIDSSIFETRPF